MAMVPYLFIVLCYLLACIDACGKNEGLATCFEWVSIDLAVFGNEADLSAVLVCELLYVLSTFVPSHHDCPVLQT